MIERIIRARRVVAFVLLAITVLFGLAIPSLEARFAPEDLVAPDASARRDAERITAEFGADETPLVVVLEAAPGASAIDEAHLVWLHRTARALAAEASVARVEGPTTTPLPFVEDVAPDESATLDTLDDEPDPAMGTPAEQEAIAAIVGADPVRFPMGLMSLAERGLRRVVVTPLLPLDHDVTDRDAARLTQRLADEPLLRRRLVSDDRRVAILAVMPRSDEGSEALVRRTSALVAASPPPSGARVSLSGLPYLRVVMLDALHDDQILLILLAALGSLVVLVVGTRSVAGVVLPLGTVGITVVLSVGGMAMAHVPLDLLTNMIPPLLVTIGLAEAVHMVLRYDDELARAAGDREKAATRTLEAMWLACFVTTFTTAIGFGALVLSDTEALRRFGAVAAIASMVAYVVTVLFVPTLLPSFGPRAHAGASQPDALDRGIALLARRAAASPRATIGVAIALFVVSLVIARGVVVDSTLLDQFAVGSDVARVTHLLERELDGVRRLTIEVRGEDDALRFDTAAGLEDLRALAADTAAEEGVLRVGAASDLAVSARALVDDDDTSRAEPFHSDAEVEGLFGLLAAGGDRDPLARLLSGDGRAARIDVCLADRGAARILAMLERVRTDAAGRHLRVAFSGEAYDASRGLDRIVSSLGSFTSAIVLIFVVMMLLFRSVRLGLLSIPPNLLPLAMTLAYMVLRGIPLHAATVIVFTVTAGLLVDGATHVIARFREEQERGGTVHEVMMRTMETSGRGVVLSSLTLLLGYGALLFSAFEPVRLFGELSAVAIGLALIAQLVLLPAVLARYAK
jgi:predicted RND superfamily exporter protein